MAKEVLARVQRSPEDAKELRPLEKKEEKGEEKEEKEPHGANSVIAESGYNESVYKYTSSRGALEKFFVTLTGTQLPEVFG